MKDNEKAGFEIFKLYLGTAEKISDRRGSANSWMLSINSAVIGMYGYLGEKSGVVTADERTIWQWAIPIAGILVCLSWMALLQSYSTLNRAKFKVLQEIEASLSYPLFRREWEIYTAEGRHGLSKIESWIPTSFIALYLTVLTAALI